MKRKWTISRPGKPDVILSNRTENGRPVELNSIDVKDGQGNHVATILVGFNHVFMGAGGIVEPHFRPKVEIERRIKER